ncbi:unnamed protein product [Clavelina lepadiformis]|uniref:Uncharacterized protein n=1 Tax=Clavelina lepadiformis TaxID=159417 RepID=A0ABP0F9T4_CLALP
MLQNVLACLLCIILSGTACNAQTQCGTNEILELSSNKCVCADGFIDMNISTTTLNCSDKDECNDSNPDISQECDSSTCPGCKCKNTFGSFLCLCSSNITGSANCAIPLKFDQVLNCRNRSLIKAELNSNRQNLKDVIMHVEVNDIFEDVFNYQDVVRYTLYISSSLEMFENLEGKITGRRCLKDTPRLYNDRCQHLSCDHHETCMTVFDMVICQCMQGYERHQKSSSCQPSCSKLSTKNLTFPSTFENETAVSVETCPNNPGLPRGLLLCMKKLNSSQFNSTSSQAISHEPSVFIFDCHATVNSLVNEFSDGSITGSQLRAVTFQLQTLTSNATLFHASEVGHLLEFLRNVGKRAKQRNIDVFTDTMRQVAQVVSHVTEVVNTLDNTEETRQQKQDVILSLWSFANAVALTENDNYLSVTTNSFIMQASKDFDTEFSSLHFQPNISDTITSSVRVILPSSVVRRAWNATEIDVERRSTFIFYKNDNLFYSDKKTLWVVSVDVGIFDNLSNLSEPIRIQPLRFNFSYENSPLGDDSLMMRRTSYRCAYWDFERRDWAFDGCCLDVTLDPPECLCNHLTNFAVLIKSDTILGDVVLNVASCVGCGLSIAGLFLTIFVHLIRRELHGRRPVRILMFICANLCICYVIFLFGISQVDGMFSCEIITPLLHYFFLVTWFWMATYSYDMYKTLVKVFADNRRHFVAYACVFVYGCPLVIVGSTIGISVGYFDKLQPVENYFCGPDVNTPVSSYYFAENMCWLKEYSLYFGFLVPVGISLTYNCVTFFIVYRELIAKNRQRKEAHLKRTTKQSVVIAISMTTTLGITWVFGYLMLISENQIYLTITSWLFSISSAFQGLGIFILTIRKSDMRSALISSIRNLGFLKVRELFRIPRTQSTVSSCALPRMSTS